MRVLMLSWEYPPHNVGGLGKHVSELVPALANEDVEVHLLTPQLNGGLAFEKEGKNRFVYRVEPPSLNPDDFFSGTMQTNLRLQETAYALFKKYGSFDLIHVHDWLVAFAGISLKQHYKIPLVTTIHASERGRWRGSLPGDYLPTAINNAEWWLTYEAWRVICCSNYMADEVQAYFETPLDKIDIVPNGVNTAQFDKLLEAGLVPYRNKFAATDEKLVLYVGRLVEEKGLRVLIEAAPEVLTGNPKSKFVVAGTGPKHQEFRELVIQNGMENNFYFTGFISDEDRNKLYRVADVAVIPSLYEPFGIVALEAMAAKVPIVVTDTGGMSEVVSNHLTGLKVFPNDAGSLAWGILHTLNYPEWSSARVKNAYSAVRNLFNWPRVARLTINVYRMVLNEYDAGEWGKEEKEPKVVVDRDQNGVNPLLLRSQNKV